MKKIIILYIKPEQCKLLADRRKTVVLQKTKPKLCTPFRCYMYAGANRIIGEFVCDHIDRYVQTYSGEYTGVGGEFYIHPIPYDQIAIDKYALAEYGNGEDVYGWHISNLIIYDEPKELSDFYAHDFDKIYSRWEDLHAIGIKGIDSVTFPPEPKKEDYRVVTLSLPWRYAFV